jgi:hypothetical protein
MESFGGLYIRLMDRVDITGYTTWFERSACEAHNGEYSREQIYFRRSSRSEVEDNFVFVKE